MYRKIVFILLLLVMGVVFACTSNKNPIKPIAPDPHQFIRGRVLLENQTHHGHCPVALDSLNIGTLSDSSGYYEIFLDDSLAEVTGKFNIYFYLYDYELDTLSVNLENGKVSWGEADVREDGSLPTITLQQLFSLQVICNKEQYMIGEKGGYGAYFTNTSGWIISVSDNAVQGLYDITTNKTEWYLPQDPVPSASSIFPGNTCRFGHEFYFTKPGKYYFIVFHGLYYYNLAGSEYHLHIPPESVMELLAYLENQHKEIAYEGGPYFVFLNDSKNLHYPLIETIEN